MAFNWNTQAVLSQAQSNPVSFLQEKYKLTQDAANTLLNATKVNPLCTEPIIGILLCTDEIDDQLDEKITDQNIADFMNKFNETGEIPGINGISV